MPCFSNSLSNTCRSTRPQLRARNRPQSLRLTNRATATLVEILAQTLPRVDPRKGRRALPRSPLPCRSPPVNNLSRLHPTTLIASLNSRWWEALFKESIISNSRIGWGCNRSHNQDSEALMGRLLTPIRWLLRWWAQSLNKMGLTTKIPRSAIQDGLDKTSSKTWTHLPLWTTTQVDRQLKLQALKVFKETSRH
jgi:hypothetical protein